jgi:hypothetical protein
MADTAGSNRSIRAPAIGAAQDPGPPQNQTSVSVFLITENKSRGAWQGRNRGSNTKPMVQITTYRPDFNPCLEAALDYLRRRLTPLALCPPDHRGVSRKHSQECNSPGKSPFHKWKQFQTRQPTETEIRQWFKQVPNANVGLALGDIVRIDVDGEAGEALLRELCDEMPVTVEFTSPSGGRGLLFRVPPGAKIKTTTKRKPEAIGKHQELRFQARGAQTVVPPSRLANCEWRWSPGRGINEVEIAFLPSRLIDLMAPANSQPKAPSVKNASSQIGRSAYGRAALKNECAKLAATPDGGRNDQLFKSSAALFSMVAGGELTADEVEANLLNACEANGLLRDDEAGVRKTIESGRKAGFQNPRTAPPQINGKPFHEADDENETPTDPDNTIPDHILDEAPPPQDYVDSAQTSPHDGASFAAPIPVGTIPVAPTFPTEVFPKSIECLVDEITWAMNCPPDFAGIPILTLSGGAIGNSRHVRITESHTQPPLLFSGIVSPPGTAKSPPLKLLREPFDAIQDAWINRYRLDCANWHDDDEGRRGPRPTLTRCIVCNITTERLGHLLTENPRGFVMVQDELMSLVNGLNQYKQGRGNDRQFFLAAWSQESINIDRQGDRDRDGIPLFVRNPFLAIHGNLQDDILCKLRGETHRGTPARDDGWQDRFLLAYPTVLPDVGEQWRCVSDDAIAGWRTTVESLLKLKMVPEKHGHRPFFVLLRKCAREAWQTFTSDHAAERNAPDFPRYLVGPWSKLKAYCTRLALIVHQLRLVHGETNEQEIDATSMSRAVKLINYFKGHAVKVHALMDADPYMADARKVLKWILSNHRERFTKRDVHVSHRATFRTADEIDPVLGILERHFIIIPVGERERTGPGRKGSPEYIVNPRIYTEDFRTP